MSQPLAVSSTTKARYATLLSCFESLRATAHAKLYEASDEQLGVAIFGAFKGRRMPLRRPRTIDDTLLVAV